MNLKRNDLSTALEGTNKDGGATVQTSRLRSRGQKEMFRCQVEPFDCAQDRLRRNLFDTQGWLIVSSHVQRPLVCARGENVFRMILKGSLILLHNVCLSLKVAWFFKAIVKSIRTNCCSTWFFFITGHKQESSYNYQIK